MRITDLLDRRSIALDARPASKKEALDTVIQLMICLLYTSPSPRDTR